MHISLCVLLVHVGARWCTLVHVGALCIYMFTVHVDALRICMLYACTLWTLLAHARIANRHNRVTSSPRPQIATPGICDV